MLVADLIFYIKHRAAHEARGLWIFHSVHHSSNEFNLSTAIRLPWFGSLIDTLFYVPALWLGLTPVELLLGKVLVLVYQYWIHTEKVGKLGWFDRVFNSPSNHRVHHASNPEYIDRNHGGILILWDKVFGTYTPEKDSVKIVYGTTKPHWTYNPILLNLGEPWWLVRDMWHAASLAEALRYLFKSPAFKPEPKEVAAHA